LVLAAFIILTEIVFLYFLASAGMEFVLSSIALTLALLIQLRFGIREDAATPADIVVFIFNWLFLDLAPKIQLLSVPGILVNTSTVVPEGVLVTNLICALFIVTFTVAYASLNRPSKVEKLRPQWGPVDAVAAPGTGSSDTAKYQFNRFGICLTLCICLLVVAVFGKSAYITTDTPTITPTDMIVRKFLLFLPSATLLMLLHETLRSGRKLLFSRVCVLLLLVLLVAITENPFTEKRNGLGPIYLSLIFILFELRLGSLNRRLMLLIASMVVVFPAITVLTHNRIQIQNGGQVTLSSVLDTLKDHYFSTNYDAWANIYSTVEMVGRQGIHWGQQLLGGILFFVPSSFWHAKPLATGIAIGNYLISNYSMWFTNLSAPLIAEGYIDFGAIGVALYAIGLAWLVARMNRVEAAGRKWAFFPMAVYGAFFLMFALRGSLMIAIAYGTAGLLSFLAASTLLSTGSRQIGQRYFRTEVQPHLPVDGSMPRLGQSSLHHQSRG
jgi:oligosaccharide repeat unit polymerase